MSEPEKYSNTPGIDAVGSHLPKRVREIRFDEIGFDVLADTHNMRYALSLKRWQLNKEEEEESYTLQKYQKSSSRVAWFCV